MNISSEKIPLGHRHIELCAYGFIVSDSWNVKWPRDSWCDLASITNELRKEFPNAVGFRRFIYDPEVGKKYIDKGYVYIQGFVVSKDDILSGEACGDYPITGTLRDNVRTNGFDVLFLGSQGYEKAWAFYRERDICMPSEIAMKKGGAE